MAQKRNKKQTKRKAKARKRKGTARNVTQRGGDGSGGTSRLKGRGRDEIENGHNGRFIEHQAPSLESCQRVLSHLKRAGRNERKLIHFIRKNGKRAKGFYSRFAFQAWATGRALLTLRDVVDHGNTKAPESGWERFVEEKVGLPLTTAKRWMRRAAKYPTFSSFQKALRAKAAKKGTGTSPGGSAEATGSAGAHSRDRAQQALVTTAKSLVTAIKSARAQLEELERCMGPRRKDLHAAVRDLVTVTEAAAQSIREFHKKVKSLLEGSES